MNTNLSISTNSNLNTNVDSLSLAITTYLEQVNLPTQGVLVPVTERNKVINHFQDILEENIPTEIRRENLYLSKFISACGVGLFDAALNYLWNETIVSLRKKVVNFDLEYFLESVINDVERRKKFKSPEDLNKMEDWELIKGCQSTGILSDFGYKHLDYIRDMRNWVGASHPNQNQLTGLQLLSWLETCIKEVLAKDPETPAIEVGKLLHNIRNIDITNSKEHINRAIEQSPKDILTSLLRTLFGMYTNPATSTQIRNNIKFILNKCWILSSDESKFECGIKYSKFASNGDEARKNLAHEFISFVNGLSFLPKDALIIELSEKIDNLYRAHIGTNNFYNEPPHAKILSQYISDTGNILPNIRTKYVKTLIMCKIGNGYGSSWDAVPYYDSLIEKFTEEEIKEFVKLISDPEISSRVSISNCAEKYKNLAEKFISKTNNQISLQALNTIKNQTNQQLYGLGRDSRYQQLISSYNM